MQNLDDIKYELCSKEITLELLGWIGLSYSRENTVLQCTILNIVVFGIVSWKFL